MGRAASRFYLADCADVFRQLPAGSVDVIVTSPPYNLGVQYNQYQDTLSRPEYLTWTDAWVAAAARVLRPDGSLFLNVGAKPTDPWTALDVAQAVRPHLRLQNIIHWVKSIAIDRASAGAAAGLTRDLAVGHYKPINSDRFLNDCQEFIFHFSQRGSTPLDRTLRAGIRRAAAYAAAGTRGSFPTRRSSDATATARIRPRSRRSCRSTACACTDSAELNWRWTRSPVWAARQQPARVWA